jgi:hypothetical protein
MVRCRGQTRKRKPETIEGEQAFKSFENGMKKIFRMPKSKVDRAGSQHEENRCKRGKGDKRA